MALVVAVQPAPEIAAGRLVRSDGPLPGARHRRRFRLGGADVAPAERVGSVTGIVGAAGGLGGFFPPLVMGATYDEASHSYTIGLILLTITAAAALRSHCLESGGKHRPAGRDS